MALKKAFLERSRALWVKRERKAEADKKHAHEMHKRREQQLAALKPPATPALWHPDATRVPNQDAGQFTGGGHKLVWHTTEGTSLPAYGGSSPHFTIDPRSGKLYQHIPINRAARALKAGGPNMWNTIQVEIIGFAKDSQDWPESHYARLADLARWIEANADVPRRCSVLFTGPATVKRLTDKEFFAYAGHVGHQHAPGNDHWDPGRLRIDRII